MTALVHRHREVASDYLTTLLNSATIDQLRTALVRVTGDSNHRARSKVEITEAILEAGMPTTQVAKVLLEIEAKTPVRHSVVIGIEGMPREGLTKSAVLDFYLDDVSSEFRYAFEFNDSNVFSLTIEHNVIVEEWHKLDAQTKKLRVRTLRHPMIFRFHKSIGVALLCFPGISGSSLTSEGQKVDYEALGRAVVRHLSTALSVKLYSLPIDACLNFLLGLSSPRVKLVRSDFDVGNGRMSLAAQSNQSSVEELLQTFLSPSEPADKASLKLSIAKAMRNAQKNHLVVFWIEEKVFTRIRYWDYGSELYFIWHETDSSYATVSRIVELLTNVAKKLSSSTSATMLDYIRALPPSEIILTGSLPSRFGGSIEESKSVLMECVRAGIITPVFRLRTTKILQDWPNEWIDSASALCHVFKATDGSTIDGSSPELIEVAFRKQGRLQ